MFKQETLSLKAGSVLFIPPGINKAALVRAMPQMHSFYDPPEYLLQCVWTHLSSQNLMPFFFRRTLSGEHATSYLLLDTGGDASLESLLYTIYKEYNRNGIYSTQIVNSLMSTFFLLQGYENTAWISRHNGFHWDNHSANILHYLETHFATLTVEKLAAQFGYSKRQIIRIIQSITGQTFSEIQTDLRMQKAVRMLTSGTASMDDISAETGYANLSSFYRAFKKYYDCTPKEYFSLTFTSTTMQSRNRMT